MALKRTKKINILMLYIYICTFDMYIYIYYIYTSIFNFPINPRGFFHVSELRKNPSGEFRPLPWSWAFHEATGIPMLRLRRNGHWLGGLRGTEELGNPEKEMIRFII